MVPYLKVTNNFSRIKQLIAKEQDRLTQPKLEPQRFQPQTNFFSTTTPRPRPTRPPPPPPPPTPDYDYDQDYYYYDDTGINSGEPVSDLHVKNVDEDYDQNFYSYYSDDGKKKFAKLKKKLQKSFSEL